MVYCTVPLCKPKKAVSNTNFSSSCGLLQMAQGRGMCPPSTSSGRPSTGRFTFDVFDTSRSSSTMTPGAHLLRNSFGTRPTSSSGSRRHETSGTSTSAEIIPSSVVVAVVEGRGQARGEVGMASFDIKNPELVLSQFPDNQVYANTIMRLQVLDPSQILLPKTAFDNNAMPQLLCQIEQEFPPTSITSLDRKFFSESAGIDIIRELCIPEYNSVELEVLNKYYALSAAAALIKHVQYSMNIVCSPKSLRITFTTGENVTRIDACTMRELELLVSTLHPRSTASLLGVLNHCKTYGGMRLLRVNILQPPCDLPTILLRQKALQQMLNSEELFYGLQFLLAKFPNIEHILAMLVQTPRRETFHTMEATINSCIALKRILDNVEPLQLLLKKSEDTLLTTYASYLEDVRFGRLLDTIHTVLHDDFNYEKGTLNKMIQQCFAIKPKVYGMLDVAKRTFREVYDDIYVCSCGTFLIANKMASLRDTFCMDVTRDETVGQDVCESTRRGTNLVEKQWAMELQQPLKVAYSTLRGFYIQLKFMGPAPQLPESFIKVTIHKTCLSCTTDGLVKLNDRARVSMHQIYSMSSGILRNLISTIINDIGCLYKLAEVVSNVDFLHSLAETCTLSDYVCPEFTDTLCIRGGRHPLLEKVGMQPFVPNDTFATKDTNFVVITGPNMSGKSTYLKQVATLQIMAQMGSYVPATEASFRIADQIFSRTGHRDDIETSCSTFLMEMKAINYVLQNFKDTSLIVIDELGRGTSEDEGAAMCVAISEQLMDSEAFIFISTHFELMTELESAYPNVANYHMEGEMEETDNGEGQGVLKYAHKLTRGCCMDEDNAFKLAEISNIPTDVVSSAREISKKICRRAEAGAHDGREAVEIRRSEAELMNMLVQIARNPPTYSTQLVEIFRKLQLQARHIKEVKRGF
ncbi:mutS protein homolog 4-like [Ornithodoros turicata]|uniref:mutS protein homolog 4-like n=1 Tax=Ornithodoros turicata TaxID=34597 RepID=UPI003138FB84